MALSSWWYSDPLPTFPPLHGFRARQEADDELLALINRLPLLEVHNRRQGGHHPYVAYLNGQPAAYGWVATREARIGELNLVFTLPPGQRYLWDFTTLPKFRGQGIYPRLLQSILQYEQPGANRFWIIHAPENLPSSRGIERAGFEPVGQLSFRLGGGVGLKPLNNLDRARAGGDLLGVPLIDSILSPCWSCGGASEQHVDGEEAIACWPPLNPSSIPLCTCPIPVTAMGETHAS